LSQRRGRTVPGESSGPPHGDASLPGESSPLPVGETALHPASSALSVGVTVPHRASSAAAGEETALPDASRVDTGQEPTLPVPGNGPTDQGSVFPGRGRDSSPGDPPARARMLAAMGRRGGQRAVAAACVVVACVACRQLVGIGDSPPGAGADAGAEAAAETGPACGIAYAGASCETCLEQRCCPQATDCSGNAGCSALETCLGACGGDPACRASCTIEHRTTDPTEPRLSACLASQCSTPCALACGGVAEFTGPDAAAACQSCLGNVSCPAAAACGSDPACIATAWCVLNGQAEDRNQSCIAAQDASADAFYGMLNSLQSSCGSACAIGNQWYCVGHESPPLQTNASTAFTAVVFDLATGGGVAGVTVDVCSPLLPPCTVLDSEPTLDGGTATVDVPRQDQGGYGPTGYVRLSGGGIVDELYFWTTELSEPTIRVQIPTLTPNELSGAALLAGVGTLDPQRAHLGIGLGDCNTSPTPGAVVTVDPWDSETRIVYDPGAAQSGTLDASNATGIVAVLNVPVDASGKVTVTVKPDALGRPSTIFTAAVAPGTITTLGILPNQ
jgi:hypothetical protein